MDTSLISVLFLAVVVIIALSVFFTFVPVMLWISALASGVRIGIITLVAMRLRRVLPSRIVNPMIKATKAGIELTINQLESHFLAGGNVDRVVNALIAAHRANIHLEFERAAAIDLAGRDVLQAVQMSVNPRVIETPTVSAVSKDGIEVKVIARVTVRANIERLVGGAGEETIIARVGEGIVTTVGSSGSHKDVLENPDLISRTVLGKGLDAGTAFEILSIDIADVDVGKKYRRQPSNGASGSRQAHRPSEGGGAARDGCRAGAGNESEGRRDEGQGGRSRIRSAACDGRSASRRQAWRHGLYELEKYRCGYANALQSRQNEQQPRPTGRGRVKRERRAVKAVNNP